MSLPTLRVHPSYRTEIQLGRWKGIIFASHSHINLDLFYKALPDIGTDEVTRLDTLWEHTVQQYKLTNVCAIH